MKYKKGDEVVIKPWGLMEQKYGLDDTGHIVCGVEIIHFTPEMEFALQGTDRTLELKPYSTEAYKSVLPNKERFTIVDEMILGYAFEWGEEIEVRDSSGQDWKKNIFRGYAPGSTWPVICIRSAFKYARPIRKPEIEITIKINDKDATPDDISDETMQKAIEKWRDNNGS